MKKTVISVFSVTASERDSCWPALYQ